MNPVKYTEHLNLLYPELDLKVGVDYRDQLDLLLSYSNKLHSIYGPTSILVKKDGSVEFKHNYPYYVEDFFSLVKFVLEYNAKKRREAVTKDFDSRVNGLKLG